MLRYNELGQIGRGSFGTVYKAEAYLPDGTRAYVALKKIKTDRREESELNGLRNEWGIQKGLNHRNIIRMLDVFETPEHITIVTEYAERGDLATLIVRAKESGQRGLPDATIKRAACDLVSALNYLFDRRILHRDLKPQNILISQDGSFKVCDFGFAKSLEVNDFLLLTSIKGTPLYMAPEMFNNGAYDQKAELWSLGCIIFEMKVGNPPFQANVMFELYAAMLSKEVNFPHDFVDGYCRSFVSGLLQIEPRYRLAWDQILQHPFIADKIDITKAGENSLTKALSPSQELVREKQLQNIQKNVLKYRKVMEKTQKKIDQAQKRLENIALTSPDKDNTQGQLIPPKRKGSDHDRAQHLEKEPSSNANEDTSLHSKTETVHQVKTTPDDGENSDSSCETLSSSSEDEGSEDEEDVRTVVNDNDIGGRGMGNSSTEFVPNRKVLFNNENNVFWKREELFTMHSVDTARKPIQCEEWIYFLNTTMKEVMETPSSICEKHFLSVLVAPLRNQSSTAEVIEKIADVLSMPFTKPELGDSALTTIQSTYIDSKVLPNLLYATKGIVRRCAMESNHTNKVRPQDVVDILTVDDLSALHKCLRLVSFLVYLENAFMVQFCDSLCVLQLFPLLRLFLQLDMKNVTFAIDTLSILCQLMRLIPTNACMVEELLFGNNQVSVDPNECWRLLSHSSPVVRSKTIRLLTYLTVHSSKSKERFSCHETGFKLWKCLNSALQSSANELREAAQFAFDNFDTLPRCKPSSQS